jgi:uncharacterized membrane protein YgcG
MALIDCYVRSPALKAADMLAVPPLLLHAFDAVLQSELTIDTAATAGLASALTSLAKRAVQLTKAAVALQAQRLESEAAAATWQDRKVAAAACFPAAVALLVREFLEGLGRSLVAALRTPLNGASSGSMSSQAAASIALLAVVLARSLVQLADAMQAAGPQLLFDSLRCAPRYMVMWHALSNGSPSVVESQLQLGGDVARHTAEGQWQYWQLHFLQAVQPLLGCLRSLAMIPAAAAAAAAAAAVLEAEGQGAVDLHANVGAVASLLTVGCQSPAGPAAEQGGSAADKGSSSNSSSSGGTGSSSISGCDSGCSCSSSSSSSSSTAFSAQQVKWSYLLQLQKYSPCWTAAAATFNEKWPSIDEMLTSAAVEELLFSQRHAELYGDAVTLCRALAAALPVTVVCNNLGCESLADVSEAAASCKACPGCKCRYCSAACYKADWKRHKQACRQLAATGFTCA